MGTWPSRWWKQPRISQLDGASDSERGFWGPWVRDPRTPTEVVAAIARLITRSDWALARELLDRPDVHGDPQTVAVLAALPGDAGRGARRFLFDRYGFALAQDPSTTAAVFRPLLEEFTHRDPPPEELARALVRHPSIHGNQELLRHLLHEAQRIYDVRKEGCRVYLERFPAWVAMLDTQGRPTGSWYSRVSYCPNLPPHPGAGGS